MNPIHAFAYPCSRADKGWMGPNHIEGSWYCVTESSPTKETAIALELSYQSQMLKASAIREKYGMDQQGYVTSGSKEKIFDGQSLGEKSQADKDSVARYVGNSLDVRMVSYGVCKGHYLQVVFKGESRPG